MWDYSNLVKTDRVPTLIIIFILPSIMKPNYHYSTLTWHRIAFFSLIDSLVHNDAAPKKES